MNCINIKKNLRIVITVIIIIMVLGCPIKKFLGVMCPTCGVTRAIISLVKGNFTDYCSLNIMALPLVFIFSIDIILKRNKTIDNITIFVSIINLIYYLYRMIF